MERLDVREQARRVALAEKSPHLQPVIEKELLHYEILAALDAKRLLDRLVFQGGTCLRLCYNSQRYSEDLDFAGGPKFDESSLFTLKDVVEEHLTKRYEVTVSVKLPKAQTQTDDRNVVVKKWQISVVTAPARPDIPQQRIKLEVASVPAYTTSVRPLLLNYDNLPLGYSDILIQAETQEEIAADKLVSLVSSKYIRYRDIWDLRWLKLRPHFNIDALPSLVQKKLSDYGESQGFKTAKSKLLNNLHGIVTSKEFSDQMRRFLAAGVVPETIARPLFLGHLESEVTELYELL
jgi:predicted nucleotidyltransferase component of viral defense system